MHATAHQAVGTPVVPIAAHPATCPAADRFGEEFGYLGYLGYRGYPYAVAGLRTRGGARPLPLYLHIPFCDYFAQELARLRGMAKLGLVTVGPEGLTGTMKERLMVRKVCMVFERYLAARVDGPRQSRTV